MKAQLRTMSNHGDDDTHWQTIAFVCPGCIEMIGGTGLHLLPVNTGGVKTPQWDFDGNIESPTLSPSILTYGRSGTDDRCHSFIRNGVIEYLGDSTHSLAGQHITLPELPVWFTKEGEINE